MIGCLPTKLNVNGTDRAIRSDFRTVFVIFTAFNDVELNDFEKSRAMYKCLYADCNEIPSEDYQEALEKATWFLDGGTAEEITQSNYANSKKVMDWEQDEKIIFSAVNKVAGYETRSKEYLHWWTFLGYFNEIGEGLFTTVINIRQKKNKGKKLEKHEIEFCREHESMIDIKVRLTAEEQAEKDYFNKLLG
jgi:hypothetical protein